jgi:hypothetical protein
MITWRSLFRFGPELPPSTGAGRRIYWPGRRTVLLLCAGLALLAGALRLVALDKVPPGLHFDEAFDALDGLKVLAGDRSIFFGGNFGREPLFMYMLAGAFSLFGASPTVIRTVPAVAGTFAVLLAYGIGRQLFPGLPWVALAAAFIQAVLPWDLHFSRYGIRVELLPLLGNAAVLCLLLGWRRWQARRASAWAWFAASGAWLGLSLYGYMAARLLPLVFLAWGLLLVAGGPNPPVALPRREGQGRLPLTASGRGRLFLAFLLAGFCATIVFAPLGLYFLRHPDAFSLRAGQVAVKGGPGQLLAGAVANAWLWLQAIPFRGDTNPRSNLPGAPALTPWLVGPFLLGLLWALRRLRHPEASLLLIWLGAMLLPSVFSQYAPSFQRAIGAVTPLCLLTALGLWLLYRLVRALWQRRWPGVAIVCLLLLGQFGLGLYQYFVAWGESDALYYAFDEGIYDIGQYMRQATLAGQWVYLSPVRPDHATLHFIMRDVGGPVTYDGRRLFVLPPRDGRSVTYIVLTQEDGASLPQVQRWYPEARQAAVFRDRLGQDYAIAMQARSDGALPLRPGTALRGRWQDGLSLVGLDFQLQEDNLGSLPLTLYWQADGRIGQDYTSFVHLLGPGSNGAGSFLCGADAMPGGGVYPTTAWRPGETIIEPRVLTQCPPLQTGHYYLEIGWCLLATGKRVPLLNPAVGDRLLLGPYRVQAQQ